MLYTIHLPGDLVILCRSLIVYSIKSTNYILAHIARMCVKSPKERYSFNRKKTIFSIASSEPFWTYFFSVQIPYREGKRKLYRRGKDKKEERVKKFGME